jgi:hypothetical protein
MGRETSYILPTSPGEDQISTNLHPSHAVQRLRLWVKRGRAGLLAQLYSLAPSGEASSERKRSQRAVQMAASRSVSCK